MSNIRWGARYDAGQQTWILARSDKTGGVLCVRRLHITCEALAEADGHMEFVGEVLVNGCTVDRVKESVRVADYAWIRHLVKVDQVVHVDKVAIGAKSMPLVQAKIVRG